jgi:nucleoside-diphosphate-sugar epimerase
MPSGLIGYTGLVGSNLLRQARFDDLYNSRNVEEIAGRHYDLLVCAGAPAAKWQANRDPEGDRRTLARLTAALERVRADRVVVISTVDVFPDPRGADEDAEPDAARQQPYGRHRHELERFVRGRFPTLVVRLPALFGPGLKKNVVYDFLHDNQVDRIHADASFQFYDLHWLWRDVGVALAHGLELIHFATEPLAVREVAAAAFGRPFDNRPPGEPASYDFRSRHAGLYGSAGGYLYLRAQVLDALCAFVDTERSKLREPGGLQPGLVA